MSTHDPDVETAARNLVCATSETEQNYWRAWLGYLLEGWDRPAALSRVEYVNPACSDETVVPKP